MCHPYATGEAQRQREINRHPAMRIETGPDNHNDVDPARNAMQKLFGP